MKLRQFKAKVKSNKAHDAAVEAYLKATEDPKVSFEVRQKLYKATLKINKS